jgi:hypothetical protein
MRPVHSTGPAVAVEISAMDSANILPPLDFAEDSMAVSHSNRTFPELLHMRKKYYEKIANHEFQKNFNQLTVEQKKRVREIYQEYKREWKAEARVS